MNVFALATMALITSGTVSVAAADLTKAEHEHAAPPIRGDGTSELDHKLRDSEAGRQFVWTNFDTNHDGMISRDEARAANAGFKQLSEHQKGKINDYDLRSYRVSHR